MLSNQILHKAVQDIKRITGLECAIWDMKGICLVMTNERMTGLDGAVASFGEAAPTVAAEELLFRIEKDLGMFLVHDDEDPCYILVLKGGCPQMEMAGRLGVSQLENLLFAYKEKMDKNRFIQNLILDNMLLVDVYNQAKKMKIPVELRRSVFLVESKNEGENLILETLKGLYATGTKDFVTAVDEKHVILVRALENTDDYPQLEQIARELVDTLNMEAMVSVRIAYGTIINELKDVSKSYKEAKMAMDVGKIFYMEKPINAYNTLGIGRLIYQLPINLCRIFITEVFGGNVLDDLDEELLTTVQKFFDNNLNVSETSRQLFVHRNTLVYRIEKLHQATGLDIRKFEDALTFKIALMVVNYMRYIDSLQ